MARVASRCSIRTPSLIPRHVGAGAPALRATPLLRDRTGSSLHRSVVQLRALGPHAPPASTPTAYRCRSTLMGEEARVDSGAFGSIRIGCGVRPLSGFVMVRRTRGRSLRSSRSSRQARELLCAGMSRPSRRCPAAARTLVYDNLRSAVLEHQGSTIGFMPRLLDLARPLWLCPTALSTSAAGIDGEESNTQFRISARAFLPHGPLPMSTISMPSFAAGGMRDRASRRHPRTPIDRRRGPGRRAAAALAAARASLRDRRHADGPLGETPSVRFDRNSYSIPHTHVRRPLTLLAARPRSVSWGHRGTRAPRPRLWHGAGRQQEAHVAGLVAATRHADAVECARPPPPCGPRGRHAAGPSRRAGRIAPRPHGPLAGLADDYGPQELGAAIARALERDALGAGAIAHILDTRRRQRGLKPPIPIAFPDRPGVHDLDVTPHRLETCDDLTRSDPDDADDQLRRLGLVQPPAT